MSKNTFTASGPLSADRLYAPCDPAQFRFATTEELPPLDDVIGQDRAVEAIKFAIGIRQPGYNLYVLGPEGTGKYSLVRRFLEEAAALEPVSGDWCYVNNFKEPHQPTAISLPPGRGCDLRNDMEGLIEDLRAAIPSVFESEDYESRKTAIEDAFKARQEKTIAKLQKQAEKKGIAVIRTQLGLGLAPVRDDEVISPDEFKKLPKKDREMRGAAIENLQGKLEAILRQGPQWEKEQRQEIRDLNRTMTQYAVGHQIEELKKSWDDVSEVVVYLDAVSEDVVENASDFLPQPTQKEGIAALLAPAQRRSLEGAPSFRRYQVNVVVDRSATEENEKVTASGAPVVFEDNPTQPNLIGRIEHLSQFGSLMTDFNLIKGGALHQANGGYLILNARKVLMQPFVWETLKRALQSGRIRIESPAESLGWVSTVTLEPQPIPLDVKVVLLGEPILYYLLTYYDPDFCELFKVASDFGDRMDRNGDSAMQYARLIGTVAKREALKPLDGGAVARVVEAGARIAGDAEKMTSHFGSIVDLVREADYWAGQAGHETVHAEDVQHSIDAKIYRSDRLRARIQEEIKRGTLIIETAGEAVGQVNGLSVIQLDDFSFGRPSRITCRTRIGRGEVVDIEREVDLGGPLHSKGVLILSGFLGSRFAVKEPLSLSASLVFEQSYGGVEGDSASSAELYALMSALSGIPVRQSIAVTGSVDQHGRVQAIGGVNEKIEGFFDVCSARGLTGTEGVIIPSANVKHLMLREDVRDAVAAGDFAVYAVDSVDQGIEILTGVPAGEADAKGEYPRGTVNRDIARTLANYAARARAFATAKPRRKPAQPPAPPGIPGR